ncbi:hypothetical protein [Kingella sp. (in: b-proteobacteria)]|uniref:hypothetical protein n=1 Tax=Kingella sp. (in: b-proteobacteria) TaxID=2020713 RepID=UPI0026DB90EC|nr:hypothetical protein [Kingella sp. (in: b-proteobacteria)]MDO4656651.1 hypothetical protein [Kingella sp. (in: b-proteobacteria)]
MRASRRDAGKHFRLPNIRPRVQAPHHISGCLIQRQPENRRVGNSLPALLAQPLPNPKPA